MANTYLQSLLGDAYKEGMTEDEIAVAIQNMGVKKPEDKPNAPRGTLETDEVKRLKDLLSKANSEAADYKKQLRTKQTEAEIKAAEEEENRQRLIDENKELSKRIAITENSAELLKMGYDGAMALQTAEALYNGDLKTVFANQKAFLDKREQDIKAQLLKGTPTPPAGKSTEGMTLEKFRNLSQADRYKFAQENPEEYKELYEKS